MTSAPWRRDGGSTAEPPFLFGQGHFSHAASLRSIASSAARRAPQAAVYAVEPEGFDDTTRSLAARVRVMPNHACMTAAAYDQYHVVDGGDEVVAVWPRTNRW